MGNAVKFSPDQTKASDDTQSQQELGKLLDHRLVLETWKRKRYRKGNILTIREINVANEGTAEFKGKCPYPLEPR